MNAPADNPCDTAEELESEARMMENRAAEVRQAADDTVKAWKGKSAADYDAMVRAEAAARETARLAHVDSTAARKLADTAVQDMNRIADAADAADAEGNVDVAAELREELLVVRTHADAMVERARLATDAAVKAEAEAVVYQARAAASQVDAQTRLDALGDSEKAADAMEEAALVMRTASAQLAEAERLDAAATDLEARGVAGADQVRAAASQARADAAASVSEARAADPTKTFGTDTNAGVDGSQIEITSDPATPAPVAPIGGDVDIEIDELDLEIEKELEYLQPLEPAPDPILTSDQVEHVADAPLEPVWDDPVQLDVDADPMPSATFEEPSYEETTASPGLDEVGDDPVFDV